MPDTRGTEERHRVLRRSGVGYSGAVPPIDLPFTDLPSGVRLRLLTAADAGRLADAYRANRAHLAPWEPQRDDAFFTEAGQAARIEVSLAAAAAGTEVPWVLVRGDDVVGVLTVTGIVRGPFLSAHLGYWVAADLQGRGICSAAVRAGLGHARDLLGLHRLQASVLPHNAPSRAVLTHAGFTLIGTAPSYLRIAGSWQDHLLYQRILD